MRVYLHIQPTFPYPVWNPTRHYVQVLCRAVFFLKNLKGRVSERTLRNTERYALSRYLPHSHFSQPFRFSRKKFAAVVSHKPTDMLSTIPTAWERSRTPMRLRTIIPNPMRWERFQKPMRWERFQNLMRWETWLLWERFLRPTILRQISKRATKAQPEEFPWPAKPKLQAMIKSPFYRFQIEWIESIESLLKFTLHHTPHLCNKMPAEHHNSYTWISKGVPVKPSFFLCCIDFRT